MHASEITLRDMCTIHQYPATAKREPCTYFMRFTHQKPSHNDANFVPVTTKLASCVVIISGATSGEVGGLVGDVKYFLVVHPSLYIVLWFIDGHGPLRLQSTTHRKSFCHVPTSTYQLWTEFCSDKNDRCLLEIQVHVPGHHRLNCSNYLMQCNP